MPRLSQPDRLLGVAMDAVGKCVKDTCLQLLELCKDVETKETNLSYCLEICRSLQEMIHGMIPYTLANEATAKLLKCIDSLSADIRQCSKEPWKEEVLLELVSAVIHPAVTMIELSSDQQHIFPFGYKWNFLIPLVYSRLQTLKELRILRLGRPQCEGWMINNVTVSETLQEFTFIHQCNDRIVAQLVDSCKSLKRLNISDSRNVTDSSIQSILKIQELEELNVIGTFLTEAGLSRLLNGLSEVESVTGEKLKNQRRLKSFGCSYITYPQLTFLVNNFPGLSEVRLSHCGVYDLSQLKLLKNLQKLSLRNVKFDQIQDLLSQLGNQLVHLDLRHIQSINIKFIGQKCLALKCFRLFSYGVLQPSLEHYSNDLLPGFQSVTCLEFDCDWNREWTGYILSQCTNVKKVDITCQRRDTYQLLKKVLMVNPMEKLEKLSWSPTSPDGESVAKQLADQCPSLKEVKGLTKSNSNYRGVHIYSEETMIV